MRVTVFERGGGAGGGGGGGGGARINALCGDNEPVPMSAAAPHWRAADLSLDTFE